MSKRLSDQQVAHYNNVTYLGKYVLINYSETVASDVPGDFGSKLVLKKRYGLVTQGSEKIIVVAHDGQEYAVSNWDSIQIFDDKIAMISHKLLYS